MVIKVGSLIIKKNEERELEQYIYENKLCDNCQSRDTLNAREEKGASCAIRKSYHLRPLITSRKKNNSW